MLLVKTPPAKIRSFSVLLGKEIGLEKKPFKGKCTLWHSSYIEIILQGLSGRSCNLEEDRGWISASGVGLCHLVLCVAP